MKRFMTLAAAFCGLSAFVATPTFAATTVSTEADLTAAIATGGEIVLGANIALTDVLEIAEGKTVTLDLAGKAITVPDTTPHIYAIRNYGTVTIKDSAGTGSISARGVYNYTATANMTITGGRFVNLDFDGGAAVFNKGTLTITAGDFDGECTALNSRSGSVTTIDGGTFSGNTALQYVIQSYGDMTINDATVDAGFGAIAVYEGTTVIKNGTFRPTGVAGKTCNVVFIAEDATLVTINDGIFEMSPLEGATPDSGAAVLVFGSVPLTINDGSFIGMNGMVSGNANTTINGGAYATIFDYNHYGSLEGYVTVDSTVTVGGKTYTKTEVGLVEVSYVAQIGTQGYATLAEAFAAVQAGETITLLRDIASSEIIVIDKAITLDGNGKTLTSTADRAINVSGADGVTIKDLTIEASGERAINIIQNATNVTIDNVTATADNYAVNVAGSAPNAVVTVKNSDLTGLNVVNVGAVDAEVTVTDTKITCDDQNENEVYAALCLNMDAVGATITANSCTFDVKDDSQKARNSAENGTITIGGSTDGVVTMVAAIKYGNYHASFATLAEAIEFAEAGETITLLADIASSEIIVINKAITLDGNGKKLTSTAGRAINVSGADGVTIKDLTIEASGERAINIIQGATNVTIDNVTATAANYTVCVAGSAANAVVTVTNSNLTGLNVVNVAGADADVTISNTTITCNDQNENESYSALALNKDATNATITATGCTFDVKDDSEMVSVGAAGGVITIGDQTYTSSVVAIIEYGDYYYSYETLQAAIDAANDGQTVKLINNVESSDIIVLNKAITLDGNGKKLTSTAGRAINVSGADGVTIKDLTIEASGERAINIIQGATNVTIDNVTATANNYTVCVAGSAANAVVTVKNSDLTGLNVVNVGAVDAEVTVTDTKITCNDQNENESYSALALNKDATNATITATGCTFDVKDDSEMVSVGAAGGVITIGDQTYTSSVVAIIEYGDYYYSYETLQAAIDAANDGQTVKLINNVESSDIIVLDKAITLDGNGKKLTSTAGRAINVSGADGVTIKDLTIEASGERAINIIQGATNVTIDNVTATANNYTVCVAGSAANAVVTVKNSDLTGLNVVNVGAVGVEVTVTDTKITCNDQNENESYSALALNKDATDGTITAIDCTFDVKGDSAKARNDAENGTITIDGKTDDVVTQVAYISYGNYYASFATLADAIEAAKAGETVVLLADVVLDTYINIPADKNLIIDLNGKTVTAGAAGTHGYTLYNGDGGTVTIKDSLGGGEMIGAIENNESTMIIDGGTFTALTNYAISNISGTMTINGGTFNGTADKKYTINSYKGSKSDLSHKLTIKDVTVNGAFGCLNTYGAGEVVIEDGAFNFTGIEGKTSHIVYTHTNTQLTINGGTFQKVGNVNISGGGDICTDGNGNLTITGGTFTHVDKYKTTDTIVISGGTYNTDPTAYVKDGYSVVENTDDTYTVTPSVAKIGDAAYGTLQSAIDAAQASDTVKILRGVAVDTAIEVTATVTVDLNGQTVATTENDTEGNGVFHVTTGGVLTLTDTSEAKSGTVNGVGGNKWNIAIFADGGKVIINGGRYSNIGAQDTTDDATHFDLIYAKNGGSVEINGGTFMGETPAWLLNLHDGSRETSSISVTGGTFYGFNPANCNSEGQGTNFCALGYYATTTDEGVTYTVVEAMILDDEIIIEGEGASSGEELNEAAIAVLKKLAATKGQSVISIEVPTAVHAAVLNDALLLFDDIVTIDDNGVATVDWDFGITKVDHDGKKAKITVKVQKNATASAAYAAGVTVAIIDEADDNKEIATETVTAGTSEIVIEDVEIKNGQKLKAKAKTKK